MARRVVLPHTCICRHRPADGQTDRARGNRMHASRHQLPNSTLRRSRIALVIVSTIEKPKRFWDGEDLAELNHPIGDERDVPTPVVHLPYVHHATNARSSAVIL